MIREFLRTISQVVTFAVRTRRLGLVLFVLIGLLMVAAVALGSFGAPLLIYPVL